MLLTKLSALIVHALLFSLSNSERHGRHRHRRHASESSNDENSNNKWNPDSYSQSTANHTLMFAYGAYCPADQLEDWSCKWCQEVPGFLVDVVYEADYLLAFTGYDPQYNQVVVSFRGTHNVEDWLYDLDAVPVDYPGIDGGTVEAGFYKAWQNLQSEILPSAQKLS